MTTATNTRRFRKVQSFQTDFAPTTITQYESERSGMQVIVADRKGPKTNGYFTLATEIFDDSGAPHTLEHLVFMGSSKNYRYKGLLDKLAGRAYSRTNAWTAVDHTAYTLETAGWDGFAQILPIYLEHVLLPNITDDACVTEVHHIDPEGNDAGVVYSEMQALQYSSGELMDLRARRLLYPENVGFRYETGGMMEALRVLTPERIREFHKAMYQPRNLAVIIVGETDHDNLLAILDDFEESIKNDIPSDNGYRRPFVDSPQPPPLKETIVETVDFPEEDESIGEILVAFFGPSCSDQINTTAMNLLLTYLCGSSVAVIENVMVEKEELASSVEFWMDERPTRSVVWFQPTSVASEKLAFVEQRLISLLKETAAKPLDMSYMHECLNRERRAVKYQGESSEEYYSTNIINSYIFGDREGTDLRLLKDLSEYDVLEKWTDEHWRTFLRKWISDAPHISILGRPSASLAQQRKVAEETRVAERKKQLGEQGLEELKRRLEEAKLNNEKPLPPHLLDKWPVPSTDSIHFIESATARSGKARSLGVPDNEAQRIISGSPEGLPLFVQFEDVPTDFVHIMVHVGTAETPTQLKPLIPLFTSLLFNSPVMRDGKRVEFEDVVKELESDTVSYQIVEADRLGDSEGLAIKLRVERDKYETIIGWLRTLMFDIIFDPVRIKATLVKALADIPEAKRDGEAMCTEVEMALHTKPESLRVAQRTLVRAVFFKRLTKMLRKDPETVVSWFEEIRRSLFTFQNIRVLVTSNVAKLSNPVAAWDQVTSKLDTSKEVLPITPPHSVLSAEGANPGSFGAVVIPMTTLDSSYSVSTAAGLSSFADARLPAYLVALGYLEAVEGPLWGSVRGNGLAYGTYFSRELDAGYIQYRVYRSPDASKAIDASRTAVARLASGEDALDRHLIEAAVSGVVMAKADEQSTMAAAAQQNFILGVMRGLHPGWNQSIMAKVRLVTDDEIRAVLRDVVMPVFEPGKSNVVVTCAPTMQESVVKALGASGYKTQVQPLTHFYDDYGLEADGEDGEDEDEDDDEDDMSEEEDAMMDGVEGDSDFGPDVEE